MTAAAVRELNHRAAGLTDRIQRVYPLGNSMAHLIGWVGRDGHGQEGLELAFDEHLLGEDGRRHMIHDAARRALRRSPTERYSSALPKDGGHIVLTIDAEVQRITEQALAAGVERFEAESGVAVVLSPINGDILAMANYPAFDSNSPVKKETLTNRRNRAITDPIEPGSAFKPLIICGALGGGFVTPDEKIDCHMGSFRFGRRLVTDTSPHGMMDVRGIISKSSNIGMGVIAHRMGNKVLHDTMRSFGLGRKTGIELPGEAAGLVYPFSRWTSVRGDRQRRRAAETTDHQTSARPGRRDSRIERHTPDCPTRGVERGSELCCEGPSCLGRERRRWAPGPNRPAPGAG